MRFVLADIVILHLPHALAGPCCTLLLENLERNAL